MAKWKLSPYWHYDSPEWQFTVGNMACLVRGWGGQRTDRELCHMVSQQLLYFQHQHISTHMLKTWATSWRSYKSSTWVLHDMRSLATAGTEAQKIELLPHISMPSHFSPSEFLNLWRNSLLVFSRMIMRGGNSDLDLWPPISNQFNLKSKWMSTPNWKNFHQCLHEILVSQKKDG